MPDVSITIDPCVQASRLLTQAISAYLEASKALGDASEQASQASVGRDAAVRRSAYQALTELGAKVRFAERNLVRISRQVHRVLSVADMEAIAKKLDRRDSVDSAWVLVKAAVAE